MYEEVELIVLRLRTSKLSKMEDVQSISRQQSGQLGCKMPQAGCLTLTRKRMEGKVVGGEPGQHAEQKGLERVERMRSKIFEQ